MNRQVQNNAIYDAAELLKNSDFDGLVETIIVLPNTAMVAERSGYLDAKPYELSENRRDYANGFKDKTVETRLDALSLKVLQTRDSEFYLRNLKKGLRSERALRLSIAKMYAYVVSSCKKDCPRSDWWRLPTGSP